MHSLRNVLGALLVAIVVTVIGVAVELPPVGFAAGQWVLWLLLGGLFCYLGWALARHRFNGFGIGSIGLGTGILWLLLESGIRRYLRTIYRECVGFAHLCTGSSSPTAYLLVAVMVSCLFLLGLALANAQNPKPTKSVKKKKK